MNRGHTDFFQLLFLYCFRLIVVSKRMETLRNDNDKENLKLYVPMHEQVEEEEIAEGRIKRTSNSF